MKLNRTLLAPPILLLVLQSVALPAGGEEYTPAQRAQDATIVETVLRLEGFDLNSSAKGKAAVLRYARANAGGERFFDLVRKYDLAELNGLLFDLAGDRPTETAGVEAAKLLLARKPAAELRASIVAAKDHAGAGVVAALGLTGEQSIVPLLWPLVAGEHPLPLRAAAAKAVSRVPAGEQKLVALVEAGELAADLEFTVGNALHVSQNTAVRAAAAKHLPLPKTKDAAPLPPLAELVERRGDAAAGKLAFTTVGTCIKCHKVRGEGKDVGPDLSEIGGKLTREAMFVSILNPSAAISHNYESYQVITDRGAIFTGLLVSQTDREVTLKTAEAIVRTVPQQQIDELIKLRLSLMPADLQQVMTADDLVNIVEYLTTLKKQEE